MKKPICIETILTEFSFEERFEQAKLAGFDYVEFWTWKDKDRGCNYRLWCKKFIHAKIGSKRMHGME